MVYEGGSYNLWIKNNGGFGVNHYLTYASSSNLLGPYTAVAPLSDWAGWGAGNEGPCLILMNSGAWRIFFDSDADSFTAGQINYSDSSDGWATWTAKMPINTATQAKHGTVIPFP